MATTPRTPLIVPLGDAALLVRFGEALDDAANRAAIAFAQRLRDAALSDVVEIAPSLVSVLIRFDPIMSTGERLAAELSLLLSSVPETVPPAPGEFEVPISFGDRGGPDLNEVAATLGLTPEAFVAAHNAATLRVLAIGFAPGFAYCGFHPEALVVPRRTEVRQRVPAGTILFAAGQTAIAATDLPTGWHVIGRTSFRNFDVGQTPPMQLNPGDLVRFSAVPE